MSAMSATRPAGTSQKYNAHQNRSNAMQVVTVDMETFWTQDYSLSKMSPLEYVMDSRFELICCSIKVDDTPTEVVFGQRDAKLALSRLDLSRTMLLGHNMSGFDSYILAYRMGIRPAMWGCTMAMARPLHAKTTGLSLAKLVQHYELGEKDNTILLNTKGKRLADFTADELKAMEVYNRADTDQCYALFRKLAKHYTAKELWQIDALTRMRTEPQFVLDQPMLEMALSIERDRKLKSLLDLGRMLDVDCDAEDALETYAEAVRQQLASAPKFSALLEKLGVDVPYKPSPTNPDTQVPALAKTDEEFIALQGHENPVVAAAARARLEVKSTLLESRIQKFLTAGKLTGGKLPIPLRYCGADTTGRDSGEEYNCFTGDVEVLTPSGWVRFDAWRGEPVMQWWPDGRATFCNTPATLVKEYDGDVVDVRAVLFDATMTPEHRLVSVRSGRVVERLAGWLTSHSGLDGVPVSGQWDGAANSRYTPEQVRVLVAIAADGCAIGRRTQNPTIQIGLRRQRKIERLRELLVAASVPFHEREYPPQEGHTGTHNTVQFVLPDCALPKGFGPWVLQLSRAALDALVDELCHWDGWIHDKGHTEFSTSVLEQAQWVATAIHLSGKATTVREYRGGRIQLHIRSSKHTAVDTKKHVAVRKYSGRVYCTGVESSYIFIRRHNKIAVAGQCQNLPRINPDKPKHTDALRRSLRAPDGYKVIVADQSGIELRVNHFLWQVPYSTELYRSDPVADLYRAFAARMYGIESSEVDKSQRQFAKVLQLGCGFGVGAAKFRVVGKLMGGLDLSEEDSLVAVTQWREQHPEIVKGWRTCHDALPSIIANEKRYVDPGKLIYTCSEGLVLPTGRLIRYPSLRQEKDKDGKVEWWYGEGRHKARIYAGKITENIVQALARDSIFDCAVEFYRQTKLRPALRVHDELVYVVPEGDAEELLDLLQGIMRTPPKWWPELVVWSEGSSAYTYGDAK